MIKDSGERQGFDTGAQRDTATGKPRLELISPIFLNRLGAHLGAGAEKYDARNWEKGIPLDRSMASLLRHLNQYREGLRDEDHLAAAACNIMFLIHTEEMARRGVLPASLMNMPSYVPDQPENTVYIAGPMRGYAAFNFPAFDEAEARFRENGWNVVNPAEMDRENGFDETRDTIPEDPEERVALMREFMERDLMAILQRCTAIAMLPGWEKSSGAQVELALARFLGLDVLDAETVAWL